MPKNSKKRNPQPPQRQRRASRQVMNPVARGVLSRLSEGERRYAALLADPCNAPLARGFFGDGSGGMIARFETDVMINVLAGSTCASVAWTPGTAVGNYFEMANPASAPTWTAMSAGSLPGATFLTGSTVSLYRPLAACIQVWWPGTELSRQGFVASLQCGADLPTQATSTADNIRAAANNVSRMPETCTELKWVPNDFELTLRNGAAGGNLDPRLSSLVVSVSGLPPATPVRVRMVAVYEFVPKVGSGFIGTSVDPSPPQGTLTRVLGAMTRFGNWTYAHSQEAAHAISSLIAGGQAAGQLVGGVRALALSG